MSFEYMNSRESIISYKNHTYTINKKFNAISYYRCSLSHCDASLSIIDNNISLDNFNHTHNPILPIKNEYLLMVSKLKMQINEEYLNISEVCTRYNKIYTILENKYDKELVTPHWETWSKKNSTFRKIIAKNKNDKATVANNSKQIIISDQDKTIRSVDTGILTNSIFDPQTSSLSSKTSKSNVKKTTSSFGFLSLESSMNDKTLEVYKDDDFVCIGDKYPKSRIHMLLIPLVTKSLSNNIKLTKVEQLIQLKEPLKLLERMYELANEIIKKSIDKIKDLSSTYPQASDFLIGFHAVQSMSPLHMHILTKDFVSPCLKHKKHWNSFNTQYFIQIECLIEHLKSLELNNDLDYFKTDQFNLCNRTKLDDMMKQDLKCHKCQKDLKNMPELKKHLEAHMK